jgi:DNA replicative helicase MCM subunit Mcm2 (Cdc46/Mcm family)
MSEAYARIHLREYVKAEDIDNAIEMLLESFL